MSEERKPPTDADAAMHAALAAAIKQAGAVAKDSRNKHFGYSYASSEDIIEESREAMAAHGLGLVPTKHKIHWPSKEDDERGLPAVVCVHYVLTHAAGGFLEVVSETPIIPEKGRPWDKALAAAKTYDLAYTLRTLLLLPRGDGGDAVDARDDRNQNARPQRPPQQRPQPQSRAPQASASAPPPATPAPAGALESESPPHDDADAGPPEDSETPWEHARNAAAVKTAEAELGAQVQDVKPPKPVNFWQHCKSLGLDKAVVDGLLVTQFGHSEFSRLSIEEKKQAAGLANTEAERRKREGAAIVRGAKGAA